MNFNLISVSARKSSRIPRAGISLFISRNVGKVCVCAESISVISPFSSSRGGQSMGRNDNEKKFTAEWRFCMIPRFEKNAEEFQTKTTNSSSWKLFLESFPKKITFSIQKNVQKFTISWKLATTQKDSNIFTFDDFGKVFLPWCCSCECSSSSGVWAGKQKRIPQAIFHSLYVQWRHFFRTTKNHDFCLPTIDRAEFKTSIFHHLSSFRRHHQ